MTFGRGWLWLGGSVVAAGAIAMALPGLARRLPFFRVRVVEVVGNRYLGDAEVVRQLHLRRGASTFDPLAPVRRAAATIPGVLAVTVARRLPGTLRVTLREAVPVGMATVNARLVLIDYRGRVLPFDPVHFPASLPLMSRDPGTAALLARIRFDDPGLYAMVQSAQLDRGDVVLDTGSREIRLRPEADDDILRGVMAVRSYLDQHQIDWREIDARYRDRVFVRRGS